MATLSPSEAIRLGKMRPTKSELMLIDLMRDYASLRRWLFANSIPPVEEVLLKFLPRNEIARLSGFDDNETDGLCSFGKITASIPCPKSILLSDDLSVRETRMTLIHEMAHMKVDIEFQRPMGHGKKWQKEMKRLARLGAFENWW